MKSIITLYLGLKTVEIGGGHVELQGLKVYIGANEEPAFSFLVTSKTFFSKTYFLYWSLPKFFCLFVCFLSTSRMAFALKEGHVQKKICVVMVLVYPRFNVGPPSWRYGTRGPQVYKGANLKHDFCVLVTTKTFS